MYEDYRATASIDLAMDEADFAAGCQARCPALVPWSESGGVGRHHRPREIWLDSASDIRRAATVPSGHHLMEKAPRKNGS